MKPMDILERLQAVEQGDQVLFDAAAEIERLRMALKKLADTAEIDMKNNQGGGEGIADDEIDDAPLGWWSLQTEDAIREARAFEQGGTLGQHAREEDGK